jgi:preprotein translocase subunit SecA
MEKLGMPDGEPIEHNMISRAIENAQARVEGHNFEIRKQLLEYDDVMNQQREVIYRQRREALGGESLKPAIVDMIREKAGEIAADAVGEQAVTEQWDNKRVRDAVFKQFNFHLNGDGEEALEDLDQESLSDLIFEAAQTLYDQREAAIGAEEFRKLERVVMLQTVDNLWKDHLLSMDHLKEGIGLRGYAQQNPLLVYKKEGFEMFNEMIARVKEETLGILFRIQIEEPKKIDDLQAPKEQKLSFSGGEGPAKPKPAQRKAKKIGRNAPCPCGSGKKYKKCCGR